MIIDTIATGEPRNGPRSDEGTHGPVRRKERRRQVAAPRRDRVSRDQLLGATSGPACGPDTRVARSHGRTTITSGAAVWAVTYRCRACAAKVR